MIISCVNAIDYALIEHMLASHMYELTSSNGTERSVVALKFVMMKTKYDVLLTQVTCSCQRKTYASSLLSEMPISQNRIDDNLNLKYERKRLRFLNLLTKSNKWNTLH